MTNKEIVLYPRGFLGFDIGLAAKDPSANLDEILKAVTYGRPVPKQDDIVNNHDVDLLWNEYITGLRYVTQTEFRDKIIIAALRAFGTSDFHEWCSIQDRSPYVTEMHRRFLNDTFGFIATGERAMMVQSWQRLIKFEEANHEDRRLRLEYDALFSKRASGFGDEDWPSPDRFNERDARPLTSLTSVIHFWIAKPNGLEDLLATLHILFGSVGSDHR